MQRTAVVTGANRGIGKEVARQLKEAGLDVLLTARNADDAARAAEEIGADPAQLDVTSDASVADLRQRLSSDGFDVLVNNAGVALDGFDRDVATRTLATNFFGVRRVTEALLPFLHDDARIVMVSSGMGSLSALSAPLRGRLERLELGEEDLVELMAAFPDEVARGEHSSHGWPSSAYRVSKIGLNTYTRLLARRLEGDPRTVLVNAVCPGWVRTRMGGQHASRSPEAGAESVTWAALLPAGGPTGGFFRDGRPIDW